MAKTSRQTSIFGVEDWKKIYTTYREADFQSYDFETLRKTFVDYLRQYYPESFNDYIESSEFLALLDVIAFMGQSLAFRNDLNTRENFLDTAERRDSVTKLAKLVGYTPKRNVNARGFLKILSASTTESVLDYNGNNLSNTVINWNDVTNPDWFEQFTAIINACLVDSQRIGRPGNSALVLGTKNDEYSLNVVSGFLPVIPFDAAVDGIAMKFEIVSSTVAGTDYVYEPAIRPSGNFNFLYKNDQQGFGSVNTGYFFYFKQGTTQSQEFILDERISNRVVDVNIDGINNSDIWLYKIDENGVITEYWQPVDSIYAPGGEQVDTALRKIYSVSSRTNDQISLNFGDGVFSEIPVGTFQIYVRNSNGLTYTINPEEIQSVTVPFNYVSRNGRIETVTLTMGLQTAINNSQNRESLTDIKSRAPARFYTQNRMVNGEDYSNFPFTNYTTILKSKAVSRTSIGVSRYLDLNDPTGKYSSTNIYASDGVIYREFLDPSFTFSFVDRNDIASVIVNQIEPVIKTREMQHFQYDRFSRPNITALNFIWQQSTTVVNQTSGYFKDSQSGNPQPVGSYTSSNAKYITKGSLIKFIAPAGYYFDRNNKLILGTALGVDEKYDIWAAVVDVIFDGTNFGAGNLDDGSGAVVINSFVPTGAVASEVIPLFVTDLPRELEAQVIDQIELYRNFGLGYDHLQQSWYMISSDNLFEDAEFSTAAAKSTSGLQEDASWLVQFVTDGATYTVTYRNLNYYFASVLENRFFYDNDTPIYDTKTGLVINDYISVLKINSKPDSGESLVSDLKLDIIGQTVESDGFVDNFKVLISYTDSDFDGIADDPDFFSKLVAPQINTNRKFVFFEKTIDFDNLLRYLPLATGRINFSYATVNDIELDKTQYLNDQIFYAYQDDAFYKLSISENSNYRLIQSLDYRVRTGRQDLHFQYRHNSPNSRRVDPAVTNVIDLYVVPQGYYNDYRNYINDSTGTVLEPTPPTIDELTTEYVELQKYKMLSDVLIVNTVKFKPLFGVKAVPELRAKIKVIKNNQVAATDSEIKSKIVSVLNEYFTVDKWDFGDGFYFSELSAYLHSQLGDLLSSVVLVPTDPLKNFGSMYEVRCQPNEIFVNAATVDDIEIVTALTEENLRIKSGV